MAEATVAIVDYTPVVPPNPFDETIKALLAAGPGKAANVTVPAEDEAKTRKKFGAAARAADRTAKNRATVINEKEGSVTLTFELVAKENRKGSGARGVTPTTAE